MWRQWVFVAAAAAVRMASARRGGGGGCTAVKQSPKEAGHDINYLGQRYAKFSHNTKKYKSGQESWEEEDLMAFCAMN
jgi:hypothetical protein